MRRLLLTGLQVMSSTHSPASLRLGKCQLFAWEEVDDGLWQDPDFREKGLDKGGWPV